MQDPSDPERIKQVAREFDEAIVKKDMDLALQFLSDRIEIEMLGLTLKGGEGARKWMEWLFSTFEEISFEPVTVMVEGNTFFEEFILNGALKNGVKVSSKQSEVLIYEDYKVRSLRIYFDRLDFAEVIGKGPLRKALIDLIRKISIKDLK